MSKPRIGDLLAILDLWRGQAAWLAAGLLVSLLAVLSFVGLLTQSGRMIGVAAGGGVLVAALLLRLLGGARVVLRYSERLLTHAATFRALADLRVWFFRKLAASAAGGLGYARAGDVLSRLVNDVEALDGLYLRIIVPAAAGFVLLPLLLLVIGPRDRWLALIVGLLFTMAAFILPGLAAAAALRGGTGAAGTMASLRIATLDLLSGLREARAFGAETRMLARIEQRQQAHYAAVRTLHRRGAALQAGFSLCGQLAVLAVLVSAGIGRVPPLAGLVMLLLSLAAFEAVAALPRAGALAGAVAASAGRVLHTASAPALADPADPAPAPVQSGLRFEAVHFGWQPDRPAVFEGLSLDLPAGARVALLGPSGSGKSTLAALALRVAAPQSGRVLLGGADIATLRAEAIRGRIGYLSQATYLFDDTVRANLLLARPEADDAALWAALDAAQIGDLIRSLPDGLESWLGEAAVQVSGGQGRRLALARCLLSTSPILILDEPCTGLDAETEQAFLTTLNQVAIGRSVLLITHRLTGVERLDRVYRLTAGLAVAAAA